MKLKCNYCGSFIKDTDEKCPNCGAVNEHLMRSADGIPKTIEELKAFCQKHNLPLEQMRFFIGENFTEPKAFGIYKDDKGNFIVYKNKADGSRTVRYQGTDEAYAVNEIYQKMKSEVSMRKAQKTANKPSSQPSSGGSAGSRKKESLKISDYLVLIIIIIGIFVITAYKVSSTPGEGYYTYDDTHYYYYSDNWYYYDDYSSSWAPASYVDNELSSHYSDYSDSGYSADYGIEPFENSRYANDSSWENDSWDDNDWDWDSNDSWDYNDSDWDSDW